MKIAVTGSGGFLGSYLCRELDSQGFVYVKFDKKKHSLEDKKTLRSLLSNSDIVIHLAAINRDPDTTKLLRVNILGTKTILDAMSMYCPKARIIFASSSQVYLKNSPYGSSKKIAEELIEEYVKSGSIRGGIILRFTNLYGSNGRPFYNSVIATFLHLISNKKELMIMGDGQQQKDFLHVRDGASAITKAMLSKHRGVETLDICTGTLCKINDLIKLIEDILKEKVMVGYNDTSLSDEIVVKKTYSKAKKILNWKPKIKLQEGLKELITNEHNN